MKTPQYLVLYKDNANTPLKYYGPFVSFGTADDFLSGLPEPAKGGVKVSKIMSQFSHDEVKLARQEILRSRHTPLFSFTDDIQVVHPQHA